MAEWLTPRTPDLEFRGSSRAQASVVRNLDGAIHRINRYPEDKYYDNQLRYLVGSNLSSG